MIFHGARQQEPPHTEGSIIFADGLKITVHHSVVAVGGRNISEPERVQIDSRMGNAVTCKDVRSFSQDACLACPHRTRDDQQRFRNPPTLLQSCHLFRAAAMEQHSNWFSVASVNSVLRKLALLSPLEPHSLPFRLRERMLSAWRLRIARSAKEPAGSSSHVPTEPRAKSPSLAIAACKTAQSASSSAPTSPNATSIAILKATARTSEQHRRKPTL